MRLRIEAEPGELLEKSDALLGALIKAVAGENPDFAERLEKALPEKQPVLRLPVLRELHRRTAAAYQKQMAAMLRDIGKVLDESLHGVEKGFYDYTKQLADQDERAFNRVKSVLKTKGYNDADFEDGGILYGISVNQLIDIAREKDVEEDDDLGKSESRVDLKALLSDNLGIPRNVMPQIRTDVFPDFLHDLDRSGVSVVRRPRWAFELRSTQAELDADKIATMMDDKDTLARPVVVSNDGYVLDGHHRWAALRCLGSVVETIEVGLPIRDLLTVAMQFKGASFAKGHDNAFD